jgi:hypothetical protein
MILATPEASIFFLRMISGQYSKYLGNKVKYLGNKEKYLGNKVNIWPIK